VVGGVGWLPDPHPPWNKRHPCGLPTMKMCLSCGDSGDIMRGVVARHAMALASSRGGASPFGTMASVASTVGVAARTACR
jgi:hypothetical protein